MGGGGSEDLPENFFEKRMQMVRSETILADCVFISFFSEVIHCLS